LTHLAASGHSEVLVRSPYRRFRVLASISKYHLLLVAVMTSVPACRSPPRKGFPAPDPNKPLVVDWAGADHLDLEASRKAR